MERGLALKITDYNINNLLRLGTGETQEETADTLSGTVTFFVI
jgi:hypothetical protein